MALLLGVTITVDRFSRSSELTAAMGAGVSLFHMTKPFILMAIILSGITLFIEGYMQPVGRYNYREVVHVVKQQSFTAALREGTFTKVGNRTFFAELSWKVQILAPFSFTKMLLMVRAIILAHASQLQAKDNLLSGKKRKRPFYSLKRGRVIKSNPTVNCQVILVLKGAPLPERRM